MENTRIRQQIWVKNVGFLVVAGLLTLSCATGRALAQNIPNAINIIPPSNLETSTAPQPQAATQPACKRLDTLRYQGRENTVFPSACDTLDADWQFRQTMYDHGFLTSFEVRQSFDYDMLGHNTKTPLYSGQNPTENLGLFFETVYDLSRLGLPDGSRFVVGPELYRDNYRLTGPNALVINELAAFVPLFKDRVEVQAGYMLWQNVFYGNNLGTSSASSALGPQSSLQTELGMATFTATPGFDVRVWAPDHRFYDHFGMSRSASPGGGYSYDTSRGPGVEWVVPGTGALFVNEVGYRIPRGPDQHYLWIRGGMIYNNTEYTNFNLVQHKVRGDVGFYLTGDYQITHPDNDLVARGLYMNFKLDAAPPDRNLYSDDASISLYDIGPFDSRPHDSASIGVTYNKFSSNAVNYYRATTGIHTANFSTTAIASYNLHLYRGVFLVNSLSWVKNPSARKNYGNAFIGTDALTLMF